jgi:hypothetical protein
VADGRAGRARAELGREHLSGEGGGLGVHVVLATAIASLEDSFLDLRPRRPRPRPTPPTAATDIALECTYRTYRTGFLTLRWLSSSTCDTTAPSLSRDTSTSSAPPQNSRDTPKYGRRLPHHIRPTSHSRARRIIFLIKMYIAHHHRAAHPLLFWLEFLFRLLDLGLDLACPVAVSHISIHIDDCCFSLTLLSRVFRLHVLFLFSLSYSHHYTLFFFLHIHIYSASHTPARTYFILIY